MFLVKFLCVDMRKNSFRIHFKHIRIYYKWKQYVHTYREGRSLNIDCIKYVKVELSLLHMFFIYILFIFSVNTGKIVAEFI